MERIKAAAIQIETNSKVITITSNCHANCIYIAKDGYDFVCTDSNCKYGFVTTDDRFVNRAEAYQIAKAAKQIYNEDSAESLESYNVRFASNGG